LRVHLSGSRRIWRILNSQYAAAWAGKGFALGDQVKYNEPIQAYDKAIDINPRDAGVWEGKGIALKALGRTSESDAACAKARNMQADLSSKQYI
jgi:Flp pilus assembly protein TadD